MSVYACRYCGPSDSSWNLVIEMAETVLEGNHKTCCRPEVHGDSRPRISPYSHLPSPRRTAAGCEINLTLDQRSVKRKRTPTHNQMLCFRSLIFMAHSLLFVLCCAAVVVPFPHPPSASSSFYVSSMHDFFHFFFSFFPPWEAPLWLLAATL